MGGVPEAASSEVWIARALRCPDCAAPVSLDERAGVLHCGHCSRRVVLDRGEALAWHELNDAKQAGAPAAEESGPPTVSCAHCGAVMTRRAGALTTQCHYCLSSLAVESGSAEVEAFDGIVPFGISGSEAREKFASWLKGAWFAPNDLARAAKLEELDSIYVPCHFWRAQAKTAWRARIGILTTAAEDEAAGRPRPPGDEGHVRTRFEDQNGVIDEPIEELESASSVVVTKELIDLGRFEAKSVVGYHQGYLGTHDAELPRLARAESHTRMAERVDKERAALAESRIEADEYKRFSSETKLANVQVRLALVPIYLVAYRYKADVFRVLVHGGTGTVTGDHPLSPWKVGCLLAILAALALAILALLV